MNKSSLAQKFGSVIRRLRLKAEMSQEEFAHHCGLHRTYIGSIERGEKSVTIETADKIARTLGIPLSQIFLQIEQLEAEYNIENDDYRS